ncbi:MAG: bifunctional cytochrome P450/NADPH--P450 reductase [Sulfurifustis sp.]
MKIVDLPVAPAFADIPTPPQLPIVGNVLQVPKGKLMQHLLEVSRHFDGIFEMNFAGRKVAFVHSAELAAEVCDETRFRKFIRPPLIFLRKAVGDALFTAHNEEPNWGKAHRILLPAFSQRAMKGYFDRMLDVAQQLVRKWEARTGEDILVADDMTRLTLDTISLTGFDYRFNSFEQEQLHPFLQAMARVLIEAMDKLTRLPIQERFVDQRKVEADIDVLFTLVDDVIRQRRAHPTDTPDLLNLMLNATDPQTGETLDDVNIRYQVITFLVAGHETTSGLLSFALYLLLRNPHVLARAYAEVDRVLPGDAPPTYAHLAQLDVIERVLKETLRIWPTTPAFAISPYETTVIGGKYRVEKDKPMSVFALGLHRDPKVWRDPDAFDIDRFLPEAEAKLPTHAYKPFGNGQRACIGRQFALTEAKLALAMVLRNFAISDPHDYRLTIKESLTLKPNAFYIRVRRRRPEERLSAAVAAAPAARGEVRSAPRVRGDGKPFTVLYGTSLGTCRDVAGNIAEQARHMGFRATTAPLDQYADDLPTEGVLIVVTSTYNGKAPDSAQRIAGRIEAHTLGAMKRPGLTYAVLGCGNSQWPNYQAFPRLVEASLAETGAAAIVPRGEADGNADFDGAVERWLAGLWKALGGGNNDAALAAPRVNVTYVSDAETRTSVLPDSVHRFSVRANEELVHDPTGLWDFTHEAPRTSTRHVTLALPEGVEYRTGDHFAVYPRNRPDRVRAVAQRLGVRPEAVVILEADTERVKHLPLGKPIAVAQLLGDFVELQDPVTRTDIRRLLPQTQCPHTRAQLEKLVADDDASTAHFQKEITEKRVTLHDLLLRFPAIQLPFAVFLDLCSPLRARFYSIASSPLVAPREITLLVGAVGGRAWAGNGEYQGTGSAYLRATVPGEEVLGSIRRPDPPFAPPANPQTPMILIGPGTGIAPFRGFLEERAALHASGTKVATSLLFYGCRHPRHDWFYDREMRQWEASGVAKLVLALSTVPEHPYRFVQDALWAERDAVWRLIESGAVIYVCGDGRAMAPAVRDTLIRIYRRRRDATHDDASGWLQELINTGRYRQDVYSNA